MKQPEIKSPVVHKHTGIGGKVSSLNKKVEAPPTTKPVAGAIRRRHIPMSEFRRYYDRRDFPIVVEHSGSGC